MRVVVTLIAILFTATVVRAQTPTTSQPSDLQVVKYSWSKDRIDWDKTPFGRQTEISNVRSRRGSILEEREAREQKGRQRNQPKEREGLLEQVIIVRILYDDGTAWQAN